MKCLTTTGGPTRGLRNGYKWISKALSQSRASRFTGSMIRAWEGAGFRLHGDSCIKGMDGGFQLRQRIGIRSKWTVSIGLISGRYKHAPYVWRSNPRMDGPEGFMSGKYDDRNTI